MGALLVDTVFRWLHVGSAIVLLGGTVFMRFVLMPQADKLDPQAHEQLRGDVLRTWKIFVHAGVSLLLISGLYNYIFVMIPKHKGDSLYHAMMGIKILLGLGVIFLGSVMVGRSSMFDKLRENRKMWLLVLVAAATVVVAISGFLKVRGIPSP
ncbi:MAG: hypothetical protein KatS3mg105_4491 [Gemmatales bacterium]|nr:MAG: hypothetical protein KatS3mg105_4491 [Gemmatales bacterium]